MNRFRVTQPSRLSLLVCLMMLLSLKPLFSQATSEELGAALQHAKKGELSSLDARLIANAGAVEAVPALEKSFSQTSDVDEKARFASALVKLRDPDEVYWRFLKDQVVTVLESQIPDSNFSISQSRMVDRSPELQAWADLHHVSLETAFYDATLMYPGKILLLGDTGDVRGLPLLRRALASQDFMIVAFAAKGLALLSDKESVPEIVRAAGKAPEGLKEVIAQALIYFDDAQAQQVADQLLTPSKAALERQARAHGRGVFGYE